MLYDLNIAWSTTTSASDLERTLRFSSQLGYNVVALNHTLDAPLPSHLTNPLPKFSPTNTNSSSTTESRTQRIPTVLRRLTITLSDPSQNPQLPKAAQLYDILALRPQTEKAFQAACLTVSATDISIISLDLTTRLPFYLRPKPCMAAVNRGLRFEICYSRALASGADARARANFIGNVAQLVRATRGRGLVVSSEAVGAMGLRAPADVVNLLAVWGLSTERGGEALRENPRGVVVNEGIKRSGFRGVVDIVAVAERGDGGEERGIGKQRDGKDNKRKNGEGSGGGEGGDQPVSKRQAKKLKAALRKKEVEGKGA
ncbi:PHP domain-like protein [Annulohypoxylon maeteangense]|uniref:PHP domain-like protein n=1 Tax=Annulohypoxylon maeteangense TaxID=1927788 RepID=UPI002007818D|nr:PHP domain-like protein [Annulohypoxylon maeteangense]KAI0881515.1 PHP domain-like protein [Annulohypoxylon maeteangense]